MSEAISRQRPLSGWGVGEAVIVLVGLGWIAFAAFWAAPGVFTIDGFVYRAMIDSFARFGSFFVANGFEDYRSGALQIPLMRSVDGRLVPQYPGGWGVLAAPAYLAAGVRGVIVLNAVASALTLALVWLAAGALFGDRRVATAAALIYGLASFAVDYTFGFWPHAVSTFLITAAFAAVAAGWRGTPAAELRGALVAGLVLGLDVNIRVDAVIAAAPLALWLLGAGRRPYAALGLMLAGLSPGLAAAAAINQVKFGIPSPVTYGMSAGATSFAYYAELVPLVAAGLLAGLALGLARVRAALSTRAGLALAAAAGLALVLAVPGARQSVLRIVEGLWILVVDFQDHPAPAHGLTVTADGTIRMYGMVKKALLQSLPYAAAIAVLVPRFRRGPDRAPLWFCALFVGLGLVPYAFGSWHGGMANNMRYFLDLVPAIAILSAAALGEIAALAERRTALIAFGAALAAGGGALLYSEALGYPRDFIAQHGLPNVVALAMAGLAALVLLTRGAARGAAASVLCGVAGAGLVVAALSAWAFDLTINQNRRAMTAQLAELTRDLPDDALVVTSSAETAGFRVNRPPALTAHADHTDVRIDPALASLIAQAFA